MNFALLLAVPAIIAAATPAPTTSAAPIMKAPKGWQVAPAPERMGSTARGYWILPGTDGAPEQHLSVQIQDTMKTLEEYDADLVAAPAKTGMPATVSINESITFCNGIRGRRLIYRSTNGHVGINEHVFAVQNGKVYHALYFHLQDPPDADAETALRSLCPSGVTTESDTKKP